MLGRGTWIGVLVTCSRICSVKCGAVVHAKQVILSQRTLDGRVQSQSDNEGYLGLRTGSIKKLPPLATSHAQPYRRHNLNLMLAESRTVRHTQRAPQR